MNINWLHFWIRFWIHAFCGVGIGELCQRFGFGIAVALLLVILSVVLLLKPLDILFPLRKDS